MVLIFQEEMARRQLMKCKIVVTFRRDEHQVGFDWATDKRGGSKMCDIYVAELITKKRSLEGAADISEIEPFTALSGFPTTKQWQDAICLRSSMMHPIGHVYLITKV